MRWRSITLVFTLTLATVAVATYVMNRDRPHGSMYGGLATSEWERELVNWDVEQPPCASGGYNLWVSRRPSAFAKLCEDVGIPFTRQDPMLPLIAGDPNALPVLMELFKSPEPKARRIAIEGVRRVGERAEIAVPLLKAALQDSDSDVSSEAAIVLMNWDEEFVFRSLAGWDKEFVFRSLAGEK